MAIAVIGLMGGFSVLVSGEVRGGLGISSIALLVGVVVAVGGIPELVLAFSLRQRAGWARWLGIVFSVMGVPVAPIGTALGLYGLWVLMSDAGLREFGARRSWLTDGSAVLVGWVFREGRGSRRRDSPAAGGLGCFVIICVIIALAVMRGGCEIVVRPITDGGSRAQTADR